MGKIKEHYHDDIIAASRKRIMDEDVVREEHKFNARQCSVLIKSWKRYYMRKNSKYPAVIQLRCHALGLDRRNWKHYIELWVNRKMISQDLITPESYDSLSYDPKLKKEEFPNLEFITLFDTTSKFRSREQNSQ